MRSNKTIDWKALIAGIVKEPMSSKDIHAAINAAGHAIANVSLARHLREMVESGMLVMKSHNCRISHRSALYAPASVAQVTTCPPAVSSFRPLHYPKPQMCRSGGWNAEAAPASFHASLFAN